MLWLLVQVVHFKTRRFRFQERCVYLFIREEMQFCVSYTRKQVDDQFDKKEIERLKRLLQALDAPAGDSVSGETFTKWWQDADVKDFLGFSQRTLERRRADKKIKFHKIGSRCYYLRTDILELRLEYLK